MTKKLEVAVKAAIEAGEEIMVIYTDPTCDFNIERKSDNSPLTIADKRANAIIERHLKELEIPIISEEGKETPFSTRKEWKKVWVVDPLDGTKEFIKRNGEFTVNIALVEDGAPILGVIYVPVTGVLYYGLKGFGTKRAEGVDSSMTFGKIEEKATNLPLNSSHEGFIVVASRSHLSEETEKFVGGLRQSHPDLEFISKGSSLKIALIAEGVADVYPRFAPTMEWDTAAGDGILRSMGLGLTLTDGSTPLSYNKENLLNPYFIASNEF